MTKQAYERKKVRPKWPLIFGSNAHKTSQDGKVIPAWNYIQKHCFKGNAVLEILAPTLFERKYKLGIT